MSFTLSSAPTPPQTRRNRTEWRSTLGARRDTYSLTRHTLPDHSSDESLNPNWSHHVSSSILPNPRLPPHLHLLPPFKPNLYYDLRSRTRQPSHLNESRLVLLWTHPSTTPRSPRLHKGKGNFGPLTTGLGANSAPSTLTLTHTHVHSEAGTSGGRVGDVATPAACVGSPGYGCPSSRQ